MGWRVFYLLINKKWGDYETLYNCDKGGKSFSQLGEAAAFNFCFLYSFFSFLESVLPFIVLSKNCNKIAHL